MENTQDYPLVSAILLAGKSNKNDILSAIKCFQTQTYPYKELIIVNNAKNHFAASELNISAKRDIFLIDTPFELSAGMARNYGISAANGQIIAQFDCDYWYSPNRLECQIATIAENESHISILSSTLSYSFNSNRASYQTNNKNAILNTMVFVRPHQIDYDNVEKYEEVEFLKKLQFSNMKIISIPAPELACKLYGIRQPSKPKNNSLSKDHFKLIKKIIKFYT